LEGGFGFFFVVLLISVVVVCLFRDAAVEAAAAAAVVVVVVVVVVEALGKEIEEGDVEGKEGFASGCEQNQMRWIAAVVPSDANDANDDDGFVSACVDCCLDWEPVLLAVMADVADTLVCFV
jgi:hypothetical protein